MNWYSIISTILFIIAGFFVEYFRTKTKLFDKAKDAIYYAEKEYTEAKSGKGKMQWAKNYISSLVPAPMKFIFTDEVIERIIQTVFDRITDYVTIQLDKAFKEKASE